MAGSGITQASSHRSVRANAGYESSKARQFYLIRLRKQRDGAKHTYG